MTISVLAFIGVIVAALMVGALAGVGLVALCVASHDADEAAERQYHEYLGRRLVEAINGRQD